MFNWVYSVVFTPVFDSFESPKRDIFSAVSTNVTWNFAAMMRFLWPHTQKKLPEHKMRPLVENLSAISRWKQESTWLCKQWNWDFNQYCKKVVCVWQWPHQTDRLITLRHKSSSTVQLWLDAADCGSALLPGALNDLPALSILTAILTHTHLLGSSQKAYSLSFSLSQQLQRVWLFCRHAQML